uniref:Uncharacterized protein n=1 Tax=Arundo donax TaxID=35708 RepID=A0A0A9EIY6_ARUDO
MNKAHHFLTSCCIVLSTTHFLIAILKIIINSSGLYMSNFFACADLIAILKIIINSSGLYMSKFFACAELIL